ncbi:hypothetical protein F2P79_010419 [Pimephales promelas]|nr:hypothetical protein F2P79_010419 [Pimephales promelas]
MNEGLTGLEQHEEAFCGKQLNFGKEQPERLCLGSTEEIGFGFDNMKVGEETRKGILQLLFIDCWFGSAL